MQIPNNIVIEGELIFTDNLERVIILDIVPPFYDYIRPVAIYIKNDGTIDYDDIERIKILNPELLFKLSNV